MPTGTDQTGPHLEAGARALTDGERLKRIEARQDQMFQVLLNLTGVLEDNQERLARLQAWANEPPSNALPS